MEGPDVVDDAYQEDVIKNVGLTAFEGTYICRSPQTCATLTYLLCNVCLQRGPTREVSLCIIYAAPHLTICCI